MTAMPKGAMAPLQYFLRRVYSLGTPNSFSLWLSMLLRYCANASYPFLAKHRPHFSFMFRHADWDNVGIQLSRVNTSLTT